MKKPSRILFAALLAGTAGCATSPMRRAVQAGRLGEVNQLLDKGYDLNAKLGDAKLTPLKFAVMYHRLEIAKALLDRGADVNIRQNGTSALTLAAMDGYSEMIALLLSKGAEVSVRDVEWARSRGYTQIVRVLQSAFETQRQREQAALENPGQVFVSSITATDSEDRPAYKLGERPDDFALVIGIEKYMDAPAAEFSERDARAVREHLTALGWPKRNIVLIAGDQAGRSGLSKYLEHWLPNNVNSNSRIFFYFAGDGAVDAASGKVFLLPWDGDANQLEATGYPLDRLYKMLNSLGSRQVIAVIDAGFSGAGPRTAAPKSIRSSTKKVDFSAADLGDVVAIFSASAGESSGVSADVGHGILTHSVIVGLNGGAMGAGNSITVKGLFEYVREDVKESAVRGKFRQTPQLLTGTLGDTDIHLR